MAKSERVSPHHPLSWHETAASCPHEEKDESKTAPIDLTPLQRPDINALKHPHIERLDPLVEPRLDALRHQAAPATPAEVVLHALLAEAVFLFPSQPSFLPAIT